MSRTFTVHYQGVQKSLITSAKVGEAFDNNLPASKYPALKLCKAIWDTGATNTSIHLNFVQELGLVPIGKTSVYGVHGSREVNKFLISILLPSGVGWTAIRATGLNFAGGDLLIGMDIISQGDFALTNFGGKTTLSFRIPSQETIDFGKPIKKEHDFPRNTKLKIRNKNTGEAKEGKWKNLKKIFEQGDWDIEEVI